MKLRIRRPSLKKKIAARTSWKRVIRHNLGVKAPRGMGWANDPSGYLKRKAKPKGLLGLILRLFR